jgi:hypothetical protein
MTPHEAKLRRDLYSVRTGRRWSPGYLIDPYGGQIPGPYYTPDELAAIYWSDRWLARIAKSEK